MKSREFDLTGNQAGGNLIDDVTHEYTYDAWNRIVEVVGSTTQDEIASYSYDALGRRINKKVSNSGALNTAGAGDFYYYDGNRLLEHHHDSPTSGEDYLREHVWGLEYIDEAVAQYDTEPGQAGELYYILIDANYNVVAVVDAGNGSTPPGTLVQQYNYWPYGTLLAAESYDAGPPAAVTAIDFETYPEQLATNIGHQGLLWDFETWLIHNRARTYAPHLGRFMQRDPNDTAGLFLTAIVYNASMPGSLLDVSLSLPYGDGMSLYQFVGSNPLIATDPSGRFSFIDISGSAALQGELASLYNDPVLSLVDAMKGIAMLQMQRYAALDNMLQVADFDFSALDAAATAYRVYQTAMLALSGKDLALGLGRVAIGSVKFGARVFANLAKRAGGRLNLVSAINTGGRNIRRLLAYAVRGGRRGARHFDDLAEFRRGLGIPPAGSIDDTYTLAKLDIDGIEYYGISAHGQTTTFERVNVITRTHAEADAVQQAINAGCGGRGGHVRMYVDRAPCGACGNNNGIGSLARKLGVDSIEVFWPDGSQVFYPTP